MHFFDPRNCVPITLCYPNPAQLAMDDAASLSRLYPVTAQNQSNFPGKQIFSTATARVHGSVWFTDSHGNRTQPMQGVNVVARWIDPNTGLPSRRYAAAWVSGSLFAGNAGNPITGFDDAAWAWIMSYHWPGNVRELKNAVERAVIMSRGDEIKAADIMPRHLRRGETPTSITVPAGATLADTRRQLVLRAFASTNGDYARTAFKNLGITVAATTRS